MINPYLSIIFPVFNEEKKLKKGLDQVFDYLRRQTYPFEVLVVNDGSNDMTKKILSTFQSQIDLQVLEHKMNLGKGAAVRTGVMAAKGNLILFSDIDLSVPIQTIKKFIGIAASGPDVIIGSRRTARSKILTHQNFARELMGRIFTKLSNLILGTKFSDFTCGFKLFTRKAAKEIFSRQKINDWAFDSEILFLAKKLDYKVAELGVEWSDVRGSKVHFPRDIIRSFLGLLKIRWYSLLGKYNP